RTHAILPPAPSSTPTLSIYPTLPFSLFTLPPPPTSTLFPYTTLFRSGRFRTSNAACASGLKRPASKSDDLAPIPPSTSARSSDRSEEHTSELQSPYDLVCRLLLEKKKNHYAVQTGQHASVN